LYYVVQAEPPFSRLRKHIGKLLRERSAVRSQPRLAQRRAVRRPRAIRLTGAVADQPWLPLLGASIVTFGFFRLMLPMLEPSWLTALLLHRGPLQPVTVGVALISLFAVVQRAVGGTRARSAARCAAGWDWPQAPISLSAARDWINRSAGPRQTWVGTRLARLVDAVATGEPGSMARDRLERADRRMVLELHQLPRATLSALPLLGLGGTVLGLSGGMGELSGFIQGATDLAGLREVLTSFSGSLATAFDATLLALALMAPLLVLAGVVRGRDETTLRLIDGLTERLSQLIERAGQPNVDEALVQRAADCVVAAVERGLGGIFGREAGAAEAGVVIGQDVAQALAEMPAVLDAVRAVLCEPRALDVRVGPLPQAKEA
jgi:hypothetical protein